MPRREFTVAGEYHYNRSSSARWIASHLLRYKRPLLSFMSLSLVSNGLYSVIATLTGQAFTVVQQGNDIGNRLILIALSMLVVVLLSGGSDLVARLIAEVLASRFIRDARDELYISLLEKSQTFHNRQRVGDIMARASNDMANLRDMVVPGFDTIYDSFISLTVNLVFIGVLNPQLLLTPLLFTVAFLVTLRLYARKLAPTSNAMRAEFGATNAVLNEAVTGIEVVKATAQEEQEKRKFTQNATTYRNSFVKNGRVQGMYLPTLLLGVTLALAFLHSLYLLSVHQISLGTLVAFMSLVTNLRYVSSISNWSFSLVQLGAAGAERVLNVMKEETELDENEEGYRQEMRGAVTFEHVTFGYGAAPVLKDVSFQVYPGRTIAIVGQTGSGKSTLTKLVNRIYDVDAGRVLVDDVDVHDWSMDALRAQVSTIEQDIFLFSRSIADNIAYGLGQKANREAIIAAAKDAQAHEFIMNFKDGYDTIIGERGVTLSGGQRQRIAIARALLTDPCILMLDDSTSAIDSATEDEIQKAIKRVLQGRTTLLITHRLSQIRWADHILVLKKGELVDQGTHEELLQRSRTYQRIFAHYESSVPTSAVGGE
ncbi:MAG TPA: ABC transporter ATP-binding protein [Ktedonobacteraceae bacterium]|nr:ABC transporter ATP-binding protein [Ktedonobacteraceae bacterium]